MRKDLRHGEDHVARIALLTDGAVYREFERNSLGVRDLVGGHKPRAQWTERIEALALDPLSAAVGLPVALRHVVGETIAGDVRKRVLTADALRFDADDEGQLYLPIHRLGTLRLHNIVVWALDAGDRLIKHQRVLGNRHARFSGVLAVVKADRDELARAANGGANSRTFRHSRHLFEVDGRNRTQLVRRKPLG